MLIGNCVQLILSSKHQKTRLLLKISKSGVFLVVQWLRLHVSTSRGMGLIPGWGTTIPYTMAKKKKKKIPNQTNILAQAGVGFFIILRRWKRLYAIIFLKYYLLTS